MELAVPLLVVVQMRRHSCRDTTVTKVLNQFKGLDWTKDTHYQTKTITTENILNAQCSSGGRQVLWIVLKYVWSKYSV